MALLIAGLVFFILVTLIVGLWWAALPSRRIQGRLSGRAGATESWDTELLKPERLERSGPVQWLADLLEQAGYTWTPQRVIIVIAGFAAVGAVVGSVRVGGAFWALIAGAITGAMPIAFLMYRRQQRIALFQTQFPDAMDMMTRAIRAGHALGGAIRLVAEEMVPPVGLEFQRVSEEIRLGLDPGAALAGLEKRMRTEDVQFFCTAVSIQRTTGGNLAEVLDRLSEVIRERFKLLSHARALSAQHKWSAIIVGISPIVFALLFQFVSPDYFKTFLASPMAPMMLATGLVSEIIGFFIIWRISDIKV
jgi:tight adherence protein B